MHQRAIRLGCLLLLAMGGVAYGWAIGVVAALAFKPVIGMHLLPFLVAPFAFLAALALSRWLK